MHTHTHTSMYYRYNDYVTVSPTVIEIQIGSTQKYLVVQHLEENGVLLLSVLKYEKL